MSVKRSEKSVLIGISAAWLHPDEERELYNGRGLLYLEQSMGEWLMKQRGVIPVMIPAARPGVKTAVGPEDFLERLDGLVVQGGVDAAPSSYGETPLREEWAGDRTRDEAEISLIRAALKLDKPVLGICRGHQVLNVALGGTLFQDVETQVEGSLAHRDGELYHRNVHEVRLEKGGRLAELFGAKRGLINSVHHQAIKDLGEGLRVEAISQEDEIIEAIRLESRDRYAAGVQWHPEFQEDWQEELLSPWPVLEDFLTAVRARLG